jgi:hypothetical protein
MIKIVKNFHFVLLAGVLILSQSVSAQNAADDELQNIPSFMKPAGRADDAYGKLNKGELINVVGNYGTISDSYLQNVIYNFTWPKSKGAETSHIGSENAADDFSFLFATSSVKNYNGTGAVIDGYTHYDSEDWRGVDGAAGHYHCAIDEQRDYLLAPDGTPMMATSDLPESWPAGWMDDTNWPGTFHPGPVGKYSELSDDDKALVDSMGAWYDPMYNKWRFWPGDFRIDSRTGKQVPGEFAGDRHVWCIMDDQENLQAPQVGVVVTMEGISYGRPYAEDFQFYNFTIRNISGTQLDSCYWGYYFDPLFGDANQEELYTYNSGINPADPYNVFIQYDPDGQTRENRWREIGVFGMAVLRTPKDIGITDAHYSPDGGTGSTYPGDDWGLWAHITGQPGDPYAPLPTSDFFHGPNSHLDDFSMTWGNMNNYSVMVMSGPFTMDVDETVYATIVVSAGSDRVETYASKTELENKDFAKNIRIAQDMFGVNFQGPTGPVTPTLYGVATDGRNTLYWDDTPETRADPFSGEYDFEGYKLYRSVDGGATWGTPITDALGELIGYVPLAQFDLKNDYSGIDPVNTNNYLGDNTGLRHTFVDSTVQNGVNYTYTITAYDRGDLARDLPSYESARGTASIEKNVVLLTPHSKPIGYQDPLVQISDHSAAVGELTVKVYDPPVEEMVFRVAFIDSPATEFSVSTSAEDTIFAPVNSTEDLPLFNGIRFEVNGDSQFGGIRSVTDEYGHDVLGIVNPDTSNRWYVDSADEVPVSVAPFEARVSNYEIRFTSDSSFSAKAGPDPQLAKLKVPFSVWNVSEQPARQVNSLITGTNFSFDLGDAIYISNTTYVAEALLDTISANWKADFAYRVILKPTLDNTTGDMPLEGQVIRIETYRAFSPADYYEVTVSPATVTTTDQLLKNKLDEVRVVPNPYVVNAQWETQENERRLRFMFLPEKCTISIFTAAGEQVTKLYHNNGTGDEDWNLLSSVGQEVAYGLYIWVVEAADDAGNKTTKVGKFIIIK